MAEVTPTQQFLGTALAILIVGLLLYGLILLIQWLTKGKGTSRIIERDTIIEETVVQPVQTQTFNPSHRNIVGLGGISTVGGVSMGAGGSAGAGMNVGGGGKAGAL